MFSTQIVPLQCANQRLDYSCNAEGLFACKDCKIVSEYCGSTCQKDHWRDHKTKCRSPLNRTNWVPKWDREHRTPAWATREASKNHHNPFGSNQYLWGNVPSIDIGQIPDNEGLAYDKSIAFLFAASGDLRNVIKTVRSLPESFAHSVELAINDCDFDVVARNVIILLMAFASLNDTPSDSPSYVLAAESLIHVWYSAFIPQDLASSLRNKAGELLHNKSTHTSEVMPAHMIRKTWTFSSESSVCITLREDQWPRIKSFLEVPKGLNFTAAQKVRAAVVMSPERADYRDRWYFKDAYPSMRIAKQKFREDGILLPFGHSRTEFDVPNPTMFQSQISWPFDDKSDPMAGWSITDVHKTPWTASRDTYGKLFAYLHTEFQSFLHRIATRKIHFRLFNVDVKLLPQLLNPETYARIEVSNISDAGYLGTRQTLSLLAPLLQTRIQNPKATIITSYLNAVMEIVKMGNETDTMPDMDFLARYLPGGLDIIKIMRQGSDFYKAWDCRTLALDSSSYFKIYMKIQRFRDAASDAELTMKMTNTIVEPWPCRLKVKPKDYGAQEEFDLLLSSSSSGVERYVEWSKI